MTNISWLILRTDARKELYVARQIALAGFDSWVPSQVLVSRPHAARRITAKAHLQAIKEIPILPRRVFAAIPTASHGDLASIRHLVGVERDGNQQPVYVPPNQINVFKAEIDRENTSTLALATRPDRKQKARWKALQDALLDMIHNARQQLEQAA